MWTKETAFLVKPLHMNVEGRTVKRVVAGLSTYRLAPMAERLLMGIQDGIEAQSMWPI